MQKSCIIVLLISILLINLASGQTITKVKGEYALVMLDPGVTVNIDQKATVIKTLPSGMNIIVGKVTIVQIKKNQCAVKINAIHKKYPIKPGDQLDISSSFALDAPSQPSNSSTDISTNQNSIANNKQNNSMLGKLLIGAGVLSLGGGFYIHELANQSYDDYQNAASVQATVDLYNETTDKDKQAGLLFGAGGGLIIVGAIVNWIW